MDKEVSFRLDYSWERTKLGWYVTKVGPQRIKEEDLFSGFSPFPQLVNA